MEMQSGLSTDVSNLTFFPDMSPIIWWLLLIVALLWFLSVFARLVGFSYRLLRGNDAFHVVEELIPSKKADSKTLLVAVHGWCSNRKTFENTASFASDEIEASTQTGVDTLLLKYPNGFLSDEDPNKISEEMSYLVGRVVERSSYDTIILMTHSMGTLLLREAYLADRRSYPSGVKPGVWWRKVSRFVQITGVNGGVDRDHHFQLRLGLWLGRWLGRGKLACAMERGSPFIENMRVAWVEYATARHRPSKGEGSTEKMPIVVQLRVKHDKIIDSANDIDVACAEGFYVFNVPRSTHSDIIDIGSSKKVTQSQKTRRELIGAALVYDASELEARANETTRIPKEEEGNVTDIVLVSHGIRDRGRWAPKFRTPIELSTGEAFKVVSPRYDRASAYTLLFGNRDKHARWFADYYVQLRTRYPRADRIHFIGHSYGTYVMAAALTQYRELKFDRVCLAGSVLPRDFDWSTKRRLGQIKSLMNVCASNDWAVALFPGTYDWARRNIPVIRNWRGLQIGDAGFAGFDQQHKGEIAFLRGGHGAFQASKVAIEIARKFIVDDAVIDWGDEAAKKEFDKDGVFKDTPAFWLKWANNFLPLFWMLVLLTFLVLFGLSADLIELGPHSAQNNEIAIIPNIVHFQEFSSAKIQSFLLMSGGYIAALRVVLVLI